LIVNQNENLELIEKERITINSLLTESLLNEFSHLNEIEKFSEQFLNDELIVNVFNEIKKFKGN
jgi:hypothetical protein